MTVARHELTEDWSEVTGLTDGLTYRCWLVGAWRPAFIWTGMDAPAADSGVVGAVLRYRERLAVTAVASSKVFARCEALGSALLLDDQVAS